MKYKTSDIIDGALTGLYFNNHDKASRCPLERLHEAHNGMILPTTVPGQLSISFRGIQ